MADQDAELGGRGQPSAAYTGQAAADELAVALGDIARSLREERGLSETLDGIARAAVQTVPGTEYAGLTVVEARRTVHTRAATDPIVETVDRAQYETQQGPCLDATYAQHTVRLSDMATDGRWPEFSARALSAGIRSMLSFQLYVTHDNLGALNLFSRKTDAFDDESEHVGLLFAVHAAVAMSGAQRERNLTLALAVRDVIGQAKGILMERHRITGDQAFDQLVRVSQRSNVKLVDVARYLVDTGELDRPSG
jgi:transcriptional regulator with GAF, ATPase, and Fis domain